MKSCDNRYWGDNVDSKCIKKQTPIGNACKEHRGICEACGWAEEDYKYKDKGYCLECLLDELGIESYTVTHYTCRGEYIASEEDIEQVIWEWDEEIEVIEH